MAKTFEVCLGLVVVAIQIAFYRYLRVPLGMAAVLVFSSLIPLLLSVFAMNRKGAEKKCQARTQRIEACRASPQSHILHLND